MFWNLYGAVMKRGIVLACLILVAMPALAEDLKLAWDPNPTSEGVTGYKVYHKISTEASWRTAIPVTETTYTLTGLPPGLYAIAVSAARGTEESDKSYEIHVQVKLAAPAGLKKVEIP